MKKIYVLFKLAFLLSAIPVALSAQQCSNIPGTNSIVPSSVTLCPGGSTSFSLANTYTASGITYQWMSSTTSAVGPFSVIPGATLNVYSTTTLNTITWYQVMITCSNGGGSVTSTVAQVFIQGLITNTPPYYEGFEGISGNNQMPNCSWAASNLGNTCLTYTSGGFSGQKYAAFYYNPGGVNYFYSNGLQLNAGVTYSAGLMYKTDNTGSQNWTNLSVLLGPNQSALGQVSVASTNGPAASANYTALGGTFTVASTGVYYIAIRGTATNTALSQYLYWDALSVTIPCGANQNSPCGVFSVSGPTTVCSGGTVVLTASCADTYTWSNGANTSTIMATAGLFYSVMGTRTLSGCVSTASWNVVVKPMPLVTVISSPFLAMVCPGQSVQLSCGGAAISYTWSNGLQGTVLTVAPLANTGYTVLGTGPNGCVGKATILITVKPAPDLNVSGSNTLICAGETATLTASGANYYSWLTSTLSLSGNQVIVSPAATIIYSLTGTGLNGCSNTKTLTLLVNECVGFSSIIQNDKSSKIYPNPTDGKFTLEINSQLSDITVFDIMGRLFLSFTGYNEKVKLDLTDFPDGIYYAKIKTASANEVIKVVKE